MNATSLPVPVPANHNAQPIHLELDVTDPEVAHELVQRNEGRERDEFAGGALRLGVIALRQANGALDAQTIHREGERLLGSVRELLVERTGQVTDSVTQLLGNYFDPKSGSLPQRLERLTKRDGEIETMLAKHLDGERSVLAQTLAQHVGQQSPLFKLLSPEQGDGLVSTLARTVDRALKAQSDEVLGQFSLDRPDSALKRLLEQVATKNGQLRKELAEDVAAVTKEFSMDHEDSALRRLSTAIDNTCKAVQTSLTLDDQASPLFRLRREMREVLDGIATSNAQFQTEVRATLESFKARREEAARSTTHGNTFEASVGEFLHHEAKRLGDLYEAVGTLNGQISRKTGDHVLTLGTESGAPGARIVCEAKARKGYTERDALEEIARARKNRDAQVGLVVMDRATAPEGIETLRRAGDDVLVLWDADDIASDLALRLAVSVARAWCVRECVAESVDEASLEQLDESIESIANQIGLIDEIIRSGRLIKRRGEKVVSSGERLRETLDREVAALQQHVKALRKEGR
ncbi:MAG: hypothetical protein ACLP1X_29345 [Polyangiaceae bacterium]